MTFFNHIKSHLLVVLDVSICAWQGLCTFRETHIAPDDRRSLGGWGVFRREANSAIPVWFHTPLEYLEAFIMGRPFPPINIRRYAYGTERKFDLERGPRTIEQLEIMHHLVKKGMCWPEDLAEKVEKFAREDDWLYKP